MARLRSFPDQRFLGTRDNMVVHDCDDDDQFAKLEARVAADQLLDRKLLQAFAPDELAEARNRGFRPVS